MDVVGYSLTDSIKGHCFSWEDWVGIPGGVNNYKTSFLMGSGDLFLMECLTNSPTTQMYKHNFDTKVNTSLGVTPFDLRNVDVIHEYNSYIYVIEKYSYDNVMKIYRYAASTNTWTKVLDLIPSIDLNSKILTLLGAYSSYIYLYGSNGYYGGGNVLALNLSNNTITQMPQLPGTSPNSGYIFRSNFNKRYCYLVAQGRYSSSLYKYDLYTSSIVETLAHTFPTVPANDKFKLGYTTHDGKEDTHLLYPFQVTPSFFKFTRYNLKIGAFEDDNLGYINSGNLSSSFGYDFKREGSIYMSGHIYKDKKEVELIGRDNLKSWLAQRN